MTPLKRWTHLLPIAALILTGAARAAAADKPNVLLIVSDDQGYADVGVHGCTDIPTPNLDRLAKSGTRCTDGYVSHPFCSPTRAGLMTGRYQHRFGHENNPFYDPASHVEGLPMTEKLLPEHMKAAGYVTGWIGKWHLGAAPEFRPINRGFTETYGFIGGGHRFQNWSENVAVEYQVPIERNGKPVEAPAHLTVAFGNEAASFIQRNEAKPWFLYLAFNSPHTPHEPTAERLAKFSDLKNPTRQKYAAQLSLMDDAIGAALDALEKSGQTKRTLIFFFSDNGGPTGSNGSINTPLRGAKGTTFEGGVRIPFFVSWPGKIPAGKTYSHPVISLDVMATALAAAGEKMPTDKKYDSVNLLPHLTGENPSSPHEQLFWRSGAKLAIREGDWKLVRNGTTNELFNLAADIGEAKDLAADKPDIAKKLAATLDTWNAELISPAFAGLQGKRDAKKKK